MDVNNSAALTSEEGRIDDDYDGRFQTARERFDSRDYMTAESLLRKLLEDSERSDVVFTMRDETIKMLATSCWELGKWDEADNLFDLQFRGRAKLMRRLANEKIETNREGVTRLLRKQFEGREPLMEILAESYVRDRLWDKAKPLLVELLHCETIQTARVERMHALAYICFAEGNFREAEAWCLKTIIGGENDAVTLLARIYNTENIDHAAYESVLSDLSPGVQGITLCTFLMRMRRDRTTMFAREKGGCRARRQKSFQAPFRSQAAFRSTKHSAKRRYRFRSWVEFDS